MSAPQQKSSKKPWSAKEDAMLLRLIEEYGSCGSWPKIALHMEWRTGKQCRERYINQLDPNIKKTPWTPEEDAIILRLHDQMGKKWSKFMDFLPGRSDNAIKNRWHVISKDTSSEHNNSLHIAYQNCQKAASTSRPSHSTPKNRLSLQKKGVKQEDGQRLSSLVEETGDNMYFDLDLIENNPSIEFDLGLFPDDGVIPAATVADEGSSPSLSPRTTNDMNESAGERDDETYATNMNMSFTYSKSSSDGMSSRESPVDPVLQQDAVTQTCTRQVSGGGHVAVPVVAHASVDAALPVTPSDGGSSQTDSRSSPTAVNAGTSPKQPNGVSPTNKANLNIDTTNNSLYDFDLCFSQKALNNPAELASVLGNAGPSLRPASAASDAGPGGRVPGLHSRSDDSVRVLQDAVCWQYDPNEDLSQALEFLMSATTSPAGTNYPGGPAFASSSGSRPGSFCASRSLGIQLPRNRSPNASYSNLLDSCGSPNTAQRVRPFSGNLASTASLLMRSNSNVAVGVAASGGMGGSMGVAGSGARNSGDGEASMSMPPPQSANMPYPPNPHYHQQYASRPLPLPPHSAPQQHPPQAPMPAQIQRFSFGSRGAPIPAIGMPQHSPMNHSHFSPACSDAKRPRGTTPYTFF